MCRAPPACPAASNRLVPVPLHIMCCTLSSSRVRTADAMPVQIAVSSTANQKGEPGWISLQRLVCY
jgi:hypothetical protein